MWTFHNPVAIHAGNGSLAQLPALLNGRRALLITLPEAAALGLEQQLRALLGTQLAGIENAVLPNPDVSWLAAIYERIWQRYADVDCIIACGAGSGSEVTPWATVWDADAGSKYSLHRDWTWPQAAIIDAHLMCSLPVASTLASGLDALSHALESIWNVNRNPVSATLAAAAARSIIDTLPALLQQPHNPALREQMAIAALQAGLAFSNTKTALAHSLSYDITLQHGIAHGIACSFSLPQVMTLAFGHDAQVDQLLLAIFHADDQDQAVARLSAFLQQLDVSTNPADYGIADSWDDLVQRALQGPRGRNFIAAAAAPAVPV